MAKANATPGTAVAERTENAGPVALNTLPGTPVSESRYLAIRPDSDVAETVRANASAGETMTNRDLVRVKVPSGGGGSWSIDEPHGTVHADSIVGVLVHYSPLGLLWPHEEIGSGSLPVLKSFDLMTAVRVGKELGSIEEEKLKAALIDEARGIYDWRGPEERGRNVYNSFGTSKNGHGKRCKEMRVMCILRENDVWPLCVVAPAGSLKTVVPFFKRLPCPHFRAIVELKLVVEKNRDGIKFSQIVPRLVGQVSRAEGEALRLQYTVPLAGMVQQMEFSQDEFSGNGGNDVD